MQTAYMAHRAPTRRCYGVFWLILLCCSSWSLSLMAQESDDAETLDDDHNADVVVDVVDVPPDPLTPSSWREVLSTARLRWSGESLADLLHESTGIYARRAGSTGAPISLTLRGASPAQVLVLWDGLALNPAQGGGADIGLLPPALIERVEVYRGASGVRFGSGALGGAINLIPRLPSQELLMTAHAGAGAFGVWRAGAGLSGGIGDLEGLLALDWTSARNDFTFEDQEGVEHKRLNAGVDRLGGALSVEATPRPWLSLRLTGLASTSERGGAGPAEFQDGFLKAQFFNADRLTSLTVDADFGDLALSLQPHLKLREVRYRNDEPFLSRGFAYNTTHVEAAFGGRMRLAYYPSWASWPDLAVDGLAIYLDGSAELTEFDRTSRVALGADEQLDVERVNVGVSSVAELFWGDGLGSVTAAARLDQISDVDRVYTRTTPALGLRVHPSQELLVMGNLARAWRAPSLDELYLDTEGSQGDPNLKPEAATSVDLGLRWKPAEVLDVEAIGFWLNIEDLILFLPASSWLYRAQNAGEATSYGAEASVGFKPTPWLRLRGLYTWTTARFDTPPQDDLPGRPAHQGSLTVTVEHSRVEAFVKGYGRSELFLDNFESLSNAAFLTADVGLGVQLGYGVSASISCFNLADLRRRVDLLQAPLPGLNVYGQLTYKQTLNFAASTSRTGPHDSQELHTHSLARGAAAFSWVRD